MARDHTKKEDSFAHHVTCPRGTNVDEYISLKHLENRAKVHRNFFSHCKTDLFQPNLIGALCTMNVPIPLKILSDRKLD